LAKAHRSTRNDHLHRKARLGSRRSAAMTLGISDLLPEPVPAGLALPALNQTLLERGKREYFEKIEVTLQGLDEVAWAAIKKKLKRWPKVRAHEHRALEPLYELLNEAKGYNYLKGIGCSNVRFVSVSTRQNEKTPDLAAEHRGQRVLCDVKTINRSYNEVERARIGGVATSPERVPEELVAKIRKTAESARAQINCYDPDGTAQRIAYFVVSYDEQEYSALYQAQFEHEFSANPVHGIQVIITGHWE
jgi:hypothetical protein